MRYLNIGLVAHVDAGKTTITEQLLREAGVIRSVGSVDSGTTLTDFLEIERKRGISVKTSSASFQIEDFTINLIDTPGHVDFAAEVERSLFVLDLAIMVISAVEGIQSHTELLLDALKAVDTPVVIFINKIDRVGSRVTDIMEELQNKYHLPILSMSAWENEEEKNCQVKNRAFSELYDEAMDLLATEDEALLERYLAGDVLSEQEFKEKMKTAFLSRKLFPVLCGSGMYGMGIKELLQILVAFGGQPKNRTDEKLSGIVYRITHDKMMGRVAHLRLFGGKLQNRDDLVLLRKIAGQRELQAVEPQKISQIRRYTGSKFLDLGTAGAGDVVALCGLSQAKVADIVGEVSEKLQYDMTIPFLKVKANPQTAEEMPALMRAFTELEAEDPKLSVEYLHSEKELNIRTTGSIQLEILEALLLERYGLKVTFSPPTVIYKETPTHMGRGTECYTMPKPCWAILTLEIEPGKRGSGLNYRSIVAPKDLLYKYQEHIRQSVPRALKQGLYNWEVTDLKVTLVGGNHHEVHTHPLDFYLATPIAVMKALSDCETTLLEPMQRMKIIAEDVHLGKVLGDMVAMRAQYEAPQIIDGRFCLEARVPAATSYDYGIRLASLTSGKGLMSLRFDGYEKCPLELGQVTKRHGVNPLDRDKWILAHRNAISADEYVF